MSIDFFLFVYSHEFPHVDLALLASVAGVQRVGGDQLAIEGLFETRCKPMDMYTRELMSQDYGKYSQQYTWFLRGTYDPSACLNQLMERLIRCAAALVASRPALPLALMQEAETFHVFNSPSRLILSPSCFDDAGLVPALFQKRYSKRQIHSY